MRHRYSNNTGLGNPEKEILENNFAFPESLKEFAEDLINNFSLMKEYDGFDYSLDGDVLKFGIEPSYMYDKLEIVCFRLDDKTKSWWRKGIAFGVYGTKVVSKYKFYEDYKKKKQIYKIY